MTISNGLIFLSLLFTIFAYINPSIYSLGISNYYLNENNYYIYILQILLYQFIHGGFLHFLFNAIFVYIFGNQLEVLIGKYRYLIFFIFNTLFVGILLSFFSSGTTIGISGFCMALLTYFTLELYVRKNPEYKGGITAIIINIIIGFDPSISLFGHLFGTISGILFFSFDRFVLKDK